MRLEPNDAAIPILLGITGAGQLRRLFDRSRIMDLVGHKVLWVTPLQGAPSQKVFEFPDASVRIDYPVWSPGKWVLFDRLKPQGGDIWMMEGFE